jgi:FkbM family methyltransferase
MTRPLPFLGLRGFVHRLRRALPIARRIPCYAPSRTGAWHFLSSDRIDDLVLDEVVGSCSHLFFPRLPAPAAAALADGGWLLDIGAYNGFWTAEMLVRFPSAHAILLEPNPHKFANLRRTLRRSRVMERARPIRAALGTRAGSGWLIPSAEGSWGNWLQTRAAALPTEGAVPVPVTTLADALGAVRPVVVKCNAEGAEFALIDALMTSDLRPDLIVLMLHPEFGDPNRVREALAQMGYTVAVALADERRPCWHASL